MNPSLQSSNELSARILQENGGNYDPYMNAMEQAMEEVSKHMRFILLVYLLTSVCGLFNAWHILASNFYAMVPPHWCKVPELEDAGWTPQQIRNISTVNNTKDSGCSMLGWNYTLFADLGYEKSLDYVQNASSLPDEIPCKKYYYDEKVVHSSVVSQWDLVCERRVDKSNVQGSIAFGKLVGGILCGFIADIVGRRPTFLICSVIYIIGGVGAALTDSLWIFFVARFLTGIAGIGCYESGFTLLAEFVADKHRAVLGCMYNMGYPLGHITLPPMAMLFRNWWHLQLAMSIPMLVFIPHFWLLPESPRWLFVHGHYKEAWKVMRKISSDVDENDFDDLTEHATGVFESANEQLGQPREQVEAAIKQIDRFIPGFSNQAQDVVMANIAAAQQKIQHRIIPEEHRETAMQRFKMDLKRIFMLFSTCETTKRISISIFLFIVASLVYYVLALNAINFDLDVYIYTFIAGWVAVPGYMFPVVVMMCVGRKIASSLLFFTSGLALITIDFIPEGEKNVIFGLAMLGRFANVAVFGLIIIYCIELFPTVVRNAAVGVSLAMSQLGSMYAPYIVDLVGPYGWYLPSTICGVCTILASMLILLQPETKGKPFLNTMEDVKNQPEKVSFKNCCKFS